MRRKCCCTSTRSLPAVNSLWFWGGGELPGSVSTKFAAVRTLDPVLEALARLAGAITGAERALLDLPTVAGAVLADLQEFGDGADLLRAWIDPALDALAKQALAEIRFLWPDGRRYRLERRHRWRLWRPAVSSC